MAMNFRGYLFDDAGSAIQGATVQLLQESDGAEEASTTTSAAGLWYFDDAADDRYDVKITRGSSIRYIQWNDQISLKEIDVRNDDANTQPAATFTNLTNNAANTVAHFRSLRGTGADNDEMYVRYYMDDASSNTTEVARMTVKLISSVADSEDSEISWGVAVGGSIVDVFTISNTAGGATDLTFDVAGDITLDADGDDIFFKAGGTTFGSATNTSGNLIIKSGTTTALTFSGANVTAAGTYTGGGLMTTGGSIVIPDAGNIGAASDTDAIAISSGGVVTMNQIPVFSAGINVSGGTIAGTLATAAQASVTSLGTLTALTVDDVAINGKVITMTGDTSDTTVITAGSAGTLSIVTTDAAGAAANIQITADGTVDIDSAGVLTLDSGAAINIEPVAGSAILLDGTISIDAGVVTGATSITSTAFVGDITGDVTGTASLATVTDSTANTNFPVVFHNESNALLDDTGALRYNPSTGQLLVPNLTVAGTTTTVDTVTMQAANAVIFEGATADAHETTLSVVDPTGDHTQYLINQGGYIPLLAAATTTAISATPAEINLIDGGTSRGTTAVASGDGILINDAGTMAMTNVDTVSTYFASHSVGGGNIVTTGALDTGSITSGFGTIDTGSSTITTTGLISGGSLDIDNVLINGTTIGHTDDTDLITVADGVVTVAGELAAATLDLSSSADIAGDLVLSGGADGALQFANAGENSIKIPDNQASALIIEEADNAYITFTTTNSSEAITIAKATTFSDDITMTADKSINLPQGANIKFTDAITQDSIDDHDAQGIIMTFTAGSNVTPFSPVYLGTDDEVHECNADAIATMPCIGVSTNHTDTKTNGQSIEVMMLGLIRDESFTDFGTNGAPVYASTTVGTMTNTAPSGTNHVVQVIGHSIGEKLLFVQPCLTTIEHTG